MDQHTTFGRWLREQRKAYDLTQLDLAMKVDCAESTIQKIENDLRRPSKQVAELMAEVFNVPTDDRPAWIAFARMGRAGAVDETAAGAGISPIPMPLTPLLGRDKELAAIKGRVVTGAARLLTLIGPPGIGKTRLSLEVASVLRHTFRDGARFVALAPLSDPDLRSSFAGSGPSVLAAIAHELGVSAIATQPLQDTVVQYLQGRQVLLVLDDFEQVVSAAPVIVSILAACSGLQVLVTSREALNVRGEQQFVVRPLPVPHKGAHSTAGELLNFSSVALFIERARAVASDFEQTEENLHAVGAICAHLEGLPLAIELAAARSKLFSPPALLARLKSSVAGGLNVLGRESRDLPERHRTLRTAIAWSYDLLNKSEQALFARLGVFAGGCTLSAIEAVCNARGDLAADVMDGVMSLVDKSLLVPVQEERRGKDDDGLDMRFSMLEMIREYTLEKLEESGEAHEVERYHAEYYLALAEAAEPELSGPKQVDWLRRLETENDNLGAALGRSYKHGDLETVLRLAGAIWRFWWVNKHVIEGRSWLESALSHQACTQLPPDVRAKAFGAAGKLAWEQADYAQSAAHLRESLVLYRQLDDQRLLASALNSLGVPLVDLCEYDEALLLFEESLVVAGELQEKAGIALVQANLGNLASYQGNWEQARELHKQSLKIRRQLDDKWHMIHSLRDLGRVAGVLGEPALALSLYEEAIGLCRQVGDDAGLALSLKDLGLLAAGEENYEQTMALCKESLAKCRALSARSGVAEVLYDMGRLASSRGNYSEAEDALSDSLLLFSELNRKRESIQCLAALGEVTAGQGRWKRAQRLIEAADILAENLTAPLLPWDRLSYDRSRANVEAHLDQRSHEAIRLETEALAGSASRLQDTIAYALQEQPGI